MLEASKQETSVTSQGDQHCEKQEDPNISSPEPVPSLGNHSAVAVLMLSNTPTFVLDCGVHRKWKCSWK